MKTFDELSDYAAHEGLHCALLDEQPVFNASLEEDVDRYVIALLGDWIPGAAGTRDDLEEGEQFEHREVWVSQPVEECGPMGAEFTLMNPDHQSWHELADLAEKEALGMMA